MINAEELIVSATIPGSTCSAVALEAARQCFP
jgi:hypothetical protein